MAAGTWILSRRTCHRSLVFNVNMMSFKHFQKLERVLENAVKNTTNVAKRRASSRSFRPETQASLGNIGAHGYVMLVIPVATFGLGTWQVYRRQWKLDLIENLSKRTSAPPQPLPQDLDELEDMEYRKFELTGTFEHDKEIYIGPRPLMGAEKKETGGLISSGQSGYLVITPFKLSDSDMTVLVNRGWVPRNKMNPSTRALGQKEGETKIVGVYRKNEPRPQFVPKSKQREKLYHYRDVYSMAEMLGTAPVFFDADAKSSLPEGPVGGQTNVTVRNEHLSYILTWYSLSLITSFLWYRRFVRKLPLM